jgi:hypothetical protein
MGRTADPWRAAETWFRCLASHSVPLHAKVLRNQAFAIGTIGLGEAGRLSDELRALVRGWIARVVRCVTKGPDCIPCGFIERSSTLHPVPPYRSSNLTDWRDPHNGFTPVPPQPTTVGGRTPLDYGRSTTFSVSLEGITETEAAGIQKFCTTNLCCAHAPGEPHSTGRCIARLPRTTRSKPMILSAPTLRRGPSMSRLSRTRF